MRPFDEHAMEQADALASIANTCKHMSSPIHPYPNTPQAALSSEIYITRDTHSYSVEDEQILSDDDEDHSRRCLLDSSPLPQTPSLNDPRSQYLCGSESPSTLSKSTPESTVIAESPCSPSVVKAARILMHMYQSTSVCGIAETIPKYPMNRNLTRVDQVYQEWFHGLPPAYLSIQGLVQLYGYKWRVSNSDRNLYYARKSIVDAVQRIQQVWQISEQEAINWVESKRQHRALSWLSKQLKQDPKWILKHS